MSQYFIDKLVYNNDTLDIHDTEAREMIANNTTNIQAVSARVTKNANDIDALEKITTDLREDVDNLDDRMGVAETEIDGLKTRTTNLEGRMNTAENRLDGHDTKISNLENRMDTAEYNIVALDGRMEAAERGIDAVEGRLDLVEAKNDEQDIAIDDLEENVAKNTADIVDIKDDLTGVHEDIEDLDDRIAASTYEAGIGIYFGQGEHHTNINVEDEILDQINQNTIDIQNLKTRVTNVENRLTVVEGDITDIKAEIVSIKADITSIQNDITNIRGDITTINNKITQIENDISALDVRITALEGKVLPSGGTAGQILKKKSDTDFDVEWADVALGTLIYHKEGNDIIFDETALLKNFTKNMVGHTQDFNIVDGHKVYAMYPQETLDGAGIMRLRDTALDLNDLYSTTRTPADNRLRGTLLLAGAPQYLLNAPSGLQTEVYAAEGNYGINTENWIKVLVYNQDNAYANIQDIDPVSPGQVSMDHRISLQKVFDLIGGDVYYRYYDWQEIEDPSNPGALIRKGWSAWKKLTGGGSGDISALEGRMTTAEGDIDSLEGRMTTAEGDIDALEGRMTTAEGNITSQGTRLTTAEGNITTLQGDVSGLGTRMTTAEGDIDTLEGRMTTAEGDIDAVELRVTAIENDPTTVDVGTTTTGAEGTQASVTNSGTTHNAVFNFTIPKGDTGATGATGPQGPTGPAGPGVAAGGTAGQVLSKVDGTDYNTQWIDPPSSGIEWEDVDYAEVKTIPTESFYWHIPEPGKKAPSSSNLTLMPFLFEVAGRGTQTLGGDIYFKREYYDTTNYMDTFAFVPSTANVDAFVMTRYKDCKWKCESYCLFSFYSTGTFNTTTQKYTFAASNITLENVSGTQKAVLKWVGYIIYNEIGNLDICGKLKGNGSNIGNLNDGGPAYIKVSSYIKGTSGSTYENTEFNLYGIWVGSGSADIYMVLMNVSGFNATPRVVYSTIISA